MMCWKEKVQEMQAPQTGDIVERVAKHGAFILSPSANWDFRQGLDVIRKVLKQGETEIDFQRHVIAALQAELRAAGQELGAIKARAANAELFNGGWDSPRPGDDV